MNSDNEENAAAETLPAAARRLLADRRLRRLSDALGLRAELHLVGGCVRDALLNRPSTDLDLSSRLTPGELSTGLEAAGIQVIPTGLRHQTVTAVPEPGAPAVEITTFRGPNMKPEGGIVCGTSIEEDLGFRDFTINAMAVPVAAPALLDPFGGRADLRTGIVRAVGSAEQRFAEDPLRTLRMIRFACQLEFDIDEAAERAAAEFAAQISGIAVERIREEFSKLLITSQPGRGLYLLQQTGLLERFAPELSAMYRFEQNRFHHLDLFEHTCAVIQRTEPRLELRLAALLHDVGKVPALSIDEETGDRHFYRHESIGADMAKEFLERLRYSKKLTHDVVLLVRTHMRPIKAGKGGLRRLLRDTGEVFPLWRALKEADASACKLSPEYLSRELEEFDNAIAAIRSEPDVSPLKNLAIDGSDLIALGLQPGPIFGRILRALHEQVLDNPELNTRMQLLEKVPELKRVFETEQSKNDSGP